MMKNLRLKSSARITYMVPRRCEISAFSRREVSWAWISLTPDIDSPTPVREASDLAHPLLGEFVDLALQARNEPELRWIQCDRRQAEEQVLLEYEEQVGHEQPALERRQRERLADEAAERLRLGRDHGYDLALRGALEVRQREAQDAAVQFVAKSRQHSFADDAAVDVDGILDAAVQADHGEEREAQRHQVRDLVHLEPQDRVRRTLTADRPVDDDLGNLERDVDEGQVHHRQDQQQHLVLVGMRQYVLVDRLFHQALQYAVVSPGACAGLRAGRRRRASRSPGAAWRPVTRCMSR
ncbi:MAG: hypothetical protein M5U09_17515 [Gammaproteobacteria bacterium]|nr:hypothetical protein [Gammaproteobacteria bacterium]